MMQSMKGATMLLGSMNRQMNLPALQRIAMEFERENDIMDQRQEMMDDAIDDVTGLEDEEEGEEVVNQVLDEIGVDLNNAVSLAFHQWCGLVLIMFRWGKHRQAYRKQLCPKDESHKQLAAVAKMTICKLAWIVCGNDGRIRQDEAMADVGVKHGVGSFIKPGSRSTALKQSSKLSASMPIALLHFSFDY
jgi:hypothetical protein